ncbi:MAG: 30S ribosomal protein S17 [Candidatus Lokiarchaeota archaeon]|nr:30S ribosomal protein S17 [Candidatus Lokiarchaeota archaeon]
MATRNIGIPVNPPQKTCTDAQCPYHGTISVRGRLYEGVVTSTSMQKTITVRRDFLFKVKKYKRYERRNSKSSVHCPPCIDVAVGDSVVYMETRKISKTVAAVVIENKTASKAAGAKYNKDDKDDKEAQA